MVKVRIIVYGIGNNFTRNYHWISRNYEIVGLVDANSKKQGIKICGFEVEGINEIAAPQYEKVLVTPFGGARIREELVEKGVDYEQIVLLEELKGFQKLPDSTDLYEESNLKKCIDLTFVCNGGAGNQFVLMNFIYCVKQYLIDDPVDITIYASKSDELNQFISYNNSFTIKNWSESYLGLNSDVLVELDFFPFVLQEKSFVKDISPKLHRLLDSWRRESQDENIQWGRVHPDENYFVYEYAQKHGKTNLTIMDVDSYLNVLNEYLWHPYIKNDESYEEIGLLEGEYITIQRGATPGIDGDKSPKLWPIDYYNELIKLLHNVYPEKKIVQVGRTNNSVVLNGIDINLLDKTSWDELASVLKNAWLHIDGECGMVHLRASLTNKPSVVLFGSTPRFFYGYDNNINLRAAVCEDGCARKKKNWQTRCAKDYDNPLCMELLTPEYVMSNIVLWERVQLIKRGLISNAIRFENDKLMSDERIIIDKKFAIDFLSTYKVYHYEIQELSLSDIRACYFSENGLQHISIDETKVYESLVNKDKTIYSDYVKTQIDRDNNDILSLDRFDNLISNLEELGFDERQMIIIDENNIILDGQHRAAWLACKYGIDSKVVVAKLYTLNSLELFPFDKIKRGSKVIIYGLGNAGNSYIKQIEETSYCIIIGVMDKRNDDNHKYPWLNPGAINKQTVDEADNVLIASRNKKNINDMYNNLITNNVEEDKIICFGFGKENQ